MKIPATPFPRLLRAALLIVLLVAQGLAAAHEYTHWDQASQELCATCSISSGLDGPVALPAPVPDTPQAIEFCFEHAPQALHQGAPNPYLQRAPPVYL